MNDDRIDPQEVSDFLNEKNSQSKLKKGDTLEVNLEDSSQEEASPKEDIPAEPDMGGFEQPNMHQYNSWVMASDVTGVVEVTEPAEQAFLRAALNDCPVEFTIELSMGVKCGFRSLYNNEIDLIFYTISKYLSQEDSQNNRLEPLPYTSRFQLYASALQLQKFNDENLEGLNWKPEDIPGNWEKAAEDLHNYAMSDFVRSDTKWSFILSAIRIFTAKINKCTENMHNGNFWNPAD